MGAKANSVFLCLSILLTACSVLPLGTAVPGKLQIVVLPEGSGVMVDGVQVGNTPLTIDLSPGPHDIRVVSEGYAPLEREMSVVSGQMASLQGELGDISAPEIDLACSADQVQRGGSLQIRATADDNRQLGAIELFIDGQLVMTTPTQPLTYRWDTSQAVSGTHQVTVVARDSAGNEKEESVQVEILEPPPSPTATPTSGPQIPQVTLSESSITIMSYPYDLYLVDDFDGRYGVAYKWLNRGLYEASFPTPRERTFKALVLENEYLKLTVLPELGGRIYQCLLKATGQDIFYHNPVLKPSFWGPLVERDRNWWLAAGGLEWAFPTYEHGYEWGLPWTYSVQNSNQGVTLLLRDTQEARLRVSVSITLLPGKAYFTLEPRIENPTSQPLSYQYWSNALLTLGSSTMSPNTEFIYPTDQVLIHGTGPNSGLPQEGTISWPLYEGRDLSRYQNWHDWLGFFIPQPKSDFVGAYNYDTDLGVVRVFPASEVSGVKLFAFGLSSNLSGEYTDNGSQYFEMWGGVTPTFAQDATLGPGQAKEWVEYWYPIWGTEGLDAANLRAAMSLNRQGDSLLIGVTTTTPQTATVSLLSGTQEILHEQVSISPAKPYLRETKAEGPGPFEVRLLGATGETILEAR